MKSIFFFFLKPDPELLALFAEWEEARGELSLGLLQFGFQRQQFWIGL